MKLYIRCQECINTKPDSHISDEWAYEYPQEVQESGIYQFACKYGHAAKVRVRNLKHELLFEAGINAVRDGYYREAVTSFSTALERYLEFQISVLLALKNSIHAEEPFDKVQYQKVWKPMSKLSERQAGAFTMLYFAVFNQAPPVFNNKFIEKFGLDMGLKEGNEPTNLRNNVTHQGFFPSYNQAVSYGEAVWQYMHALLKTGKEAFSLSDYFNAVMTAAHNPPHNLVASDSEMEQSMLLSTFITTVSPTGLSSSLTSDKSLLTLLPLRP